MISVAPHLFDHDDPTRPAARAIVAEWGLNGLSLLALRPGTRVQLSSDGMACLGYAVSCGTAIVLGQPAGQPDSVNLLVEEFKAIAKFHGWHTAYCGVHSEFAAQLEGSGYRLMAVGDSAICDPQQVTLVGKEWREVRAALNRARTQGLGFAWIDVDKPRGPLLESLHAISKEWLSARRLPELRFATGDLTSLYDPAVRVGVALDRAGTPEGFVTWVPVPGRQGWMLELLRTRKEAMAGLGDFLIASSLLDFRTEGVPFASLGGTPPSVRGGTPRGAPRLLQTLWRLVRPVYDSEGLRHFKAKFNPAWRPLYLAYRGGIGLPMAVAGVIGASLPRMGPLRLARTFASASMACVAGFVGRSGRA